MANRLTVRKHFLTVRFFDLISFFVLSPHKAGISLSYPCSGEGNGSDSYHHCLQLLELSPSQFLQSPLFKYITNIY